MSPKLATQSFSIVTLVDFGRRRRCLTRRLINLATACQTEGLELVVGHADRSTAHDRKFKQTMQRYGAKIAPVAVAPSARCNLSRMRNIAARAAQNDVLVFIDVDIYADSRLFGALARKAERDGFSIAPCAYLKRLFTRNVRKLAGASGRDLLFDPKFALVSHFAVPSSVVAVTRRDYQAVDGFCEEYAGHGYEDFDFLLRLALNREAIARGPNLLVDESYEIPLRSAGFRAALGELCLQNLIEGNIALHMSHPKDPTEDYYRCRATNAKLFKTRILACLNAHAPDVQSAGDGASGSLLAKFQKMCDAMGYAPLTFAALYVSPMTARTRMERAMAIASKFYRSHKRRLADTLSYRRSQNIVEKNVS